MELPAGTLAPFQQQRLQSAVQFALRELLIAQPDNPVQFVAQRLREYANGRATETDAEAWRGLADDALPPDGGHRRRPVGMAGSRDTPSLGMTLRGPLGAARVRRRAAH